MGLINFFSKQTGEKGSFRRNTLIMSSGAVINIIISLILYPIITRLYTKEDFGNYGLIISVVTILSLAGTALYPTGIVIPKFKSDYLALLKLCFYLLITTVFITVLWMLLFTNSFLFMFKLHGVKEYLYLIPIGVILVALKTMFLNMNVRKKLFKHNAISNVAGSSSLKGMNIIFAISLGASSFGLMVTHFASVFIQMLFLGLDKMLLDVKLLLRIPFDKVKKIALQYKKYPLNLLPGNLLNKYTSDLPIYLLTVYFNPAITGAFVLANNIMHIPLNVLGNSMSSVFLQKSNELYLSDPDKLSTFTRSLNRKIVLLGVLAFGFLFGFGDVAFYFVFGKEWLLAGQIASVLSFYFIMKLAAGPLAVVFRSVGKEQYSLYSNIVLAVCRSIGLYAGIYTSDFMKAIILFTIGNFVGYLFTLILVYKSTNLPIYRLILEVILIIILGFALFYLIRLGLEKIININTLLVE